MDNWFSNNVGNPHFWRCWIGFFMYYIFLKKPRWYRNIIEDWGNH